jgi:hypothetical protein
VTVAHHEQVAQPEEPALDGLTLSVPFGDLGPGLAVRREDAHLRVVGKPPPAQGPAQLVLGHLSRNCRRAASLCLPAPQQLASHDNDREREIVIRHEPGLRLLFAHALDMPTMASWTASSIVAGSRHRGRLIESDGPVWQSANHGAPVA